MSCRASYLASVGYIFDYLRQVTLIQQHPQPQSILQQQLGGGSPQHFTSMTATSPGNNLLTTCGFILTILNQAMTWFTASIYCMYTLA